MEKVFEAYLSNDFEKLTLKVNGKIIISHSIPEVFILENSYRDDTGFFVRKNARHMLKYHFMKESVSDYLSIPLFFKIEGRGFYKSSFSKKEFYIIEC